MKKLLILIFILVAITSCTDDSVKNLQDELLGTWELIQFQDQTSSTIMSDLDNFGTIIITFNKEAFEGNTGSNSFFGGYTNESNVLVFSEFGITEVGESEWGSKFLDAIVSTRNASNNNYILSYIIEGATLKIEYEPNRVMHFEKNE